MRTLLACLLIFGAVMTTGPLAVADEHEKPTLVINLTSDDVWTAQMAFGFAKNVMADGGTVALFLNVRAVTLANKAVPQHVEAMSGKTAHQMLQDLMAAGARVFVCPPCTKQAGLDIANRLDGTEESGPTFRKIVMAPSTRIMSY